MVKLRLLEEWQNDGITICKSRNDKYTEVGFVGRDVESMVRDLVYEGISLVTKEYEEKIKDKIDEKLLKNS